MAAEADIAFRQALALCPYSPEAVFGYSQFLLKQNRGADAYRVAKTAADMPQMQGQTRAAMRNFAAQLREYH